MADLLADPQMTPEQLDAALGRQCGEIEGAITFAMDGVKIRTGWFGRAVRFSARADGLWGNPFTENLLRCAARPSARYLHHLHPEDESWAAGAESEILSGYAAIDSDRAASLGRSLDKGRGSFRDGGGTEPNA